jgi:eukaryotic-like serine/threonine-protein kinase
VHEEPPRLADAGAFEELLRVTMAKDPAQRWPMERVRDRLAQIRRDPAAVGVTSTQVLAGEQAPATEVLAPIAPAGPAGPAEPTDDKRGAPWLWLAGLGAALVAVVLALTLTGDDTPEPTAGEPTSDSPSSRPTSDSPTTTSPTVDTRAEVTDFITTYLATVTTDRRAAFAMLTPGFQADSGGFGSYSGFWRTIESATPSDIEVDPEALTVSYDVAYRTTDGDDTSDSVNLRLQRSGDGYLIAGES